MNVRFAHDWTDFDVVCHTIGAELGLLPEYTPGMKWVTWTNNPLGEQLVIMTWALVHCGAMHVHPDDELVLKANPAYDPNETDPLKFLDGELSRTVRFRRVEEFLVREKYCPGVAARARWDLSERNWKNYYKPLLQIRGNVHINHSIHDDWWTIKRSTIS